MLSCCSCGQRHRKASKGSLPVCILRSETHGLPTVFQCKVGSLVGFLCTFG